MKIINVLLLDDDEIFLNQLKDQVESYFQRFNYHFQIDAFLNPQDMLVYANHNNVDLLITDIQLEGEYAQGVSAAEFIRQLYHDCTIIFLTNFLHYATRVFDVQPLYFILKDELNERLPKALDLFLQAYEKDMAVTKVVSGKNSYMIEVDKLIYCEHIGRKTEIHLEDQVITVPMRIDDLYAQLPARQVVNCHKSYIVGVKYIHSYCRTEITLTTGTRIPVSRSRYPDLQKRFATYLNGFIE